MGSKLSTQTSVEREDTDSLIDLETWLSPAYAADPPAQNSAWNLSWLRCSNTPPLRSSTGLNECCNKKSADCHSAYDAVAGDAPVYVPYGFDDSATVDICKVCDKLSQFHRRGPADDWTLCSTSGHPIILLTPTPTAVGLSVVAWEQVPSMLYIIQSTRMMTLLPISLGECMAITIPIERIQAVCSFADSMPLVENSARLAETEKMRIVHLQYLSPSSQSVCIYFLEKSEHTRDRFIQELRIIWLEWKNEGMPS